MTGEVESDTACDSCKTTLLAGMGVAAAKSGVVGVSDASGVSRPVENFCFSFRFAKSFALSSDKLSFGSAGGGG